MRWDNLFDDLEAQLEHELEIDEIDLRAEDERLRLGRLTLRDRLAALVSGSSGEEPPVVTLHLRARTSLTLAVTTLGRDWLVGEPRGSGRSQQLLVPFAAVASVVTDADAMRCSVEPRPTGGRERLTERLGIAFVLRDICRRRAGVHVTTVDGEVFGTIDRVARDHLDLAVHEPGSYRREQNVTQYRMISFDALVHLRV